MHFELLYNRGVPKINHFSGLSPTLNGSCDEATRWALSESLRRKAFLYYKIFFQDHLNDVKAPSLTAETGHVSLALI